MIQKVSQTNNINNLYAYQSSKNLMIRSAAPSFKGIETYIIKKMQNESTKKGFYILECALDGNLSGKISPLVLGIKGLNSYQLKKSSSNAPKRGFYVVEIINNTTLLGLKKDYFEREHLKHAMTKAKEKANTENSDAVKQMSSHINMFALLKNLDITDFLK